MKTVKRHLNWHLKLFSGERHFYTLWREVEIKGTYFNNIISFCPGQVAVTQIPSWCTRVKNLTPHCVSFYFSHWYQHLFLACPLVLLSPHLSHWLLCASQACLSTSPLSLQPSLTSLMRVCVTQAFRKPPQLITWQASRSGTLMKRNSVQ